MDIIIVIYKLILCIYLTIIYDMDLRITEIYVNSKNNRKDNAKFTVKAIITEIKGSKVSYDVRTYNEKFTIGIGTYELHVINLDKFLNKF